MYKPENRSREFHSFHSKTRKVIGLEKGCAPTLSQGFEGFQLKAPGKFAMKFAMKFYEAEKSEVISSRRESEFPPTDFSMVMNLILLTLPVARLSHIGTRAIEIRGFRQDDWRIG